MGDGSCAFQIMRSRVHTTCTRDVCITPGHVTDKDECGLPWGTQHDMSTSKDFSPTETESRRPQGNKYGVCSRVKIRSRRSGERALHYAGRIRKRKGRAIASRISFGNLVSTVHEQRERRKRNRHSRDIPVRKENASSSLPRPTLAAWDARRKRNLRFQKPNYTLDTLFQSHCPLLRLARSLFLSLALFLSCSRFSLWHEDRRRVVAAGQTRGKCAA